ncbi:alpha/beta fold hydrolase [Nocardia sp. NBC_01730]|uniref:alpha/beta fold hydrolase n=1 Tax=Nocardia sp. NBC_01730 TaxID=2975998 RepID=UPI002E0F22C4|nr:alpha/beta fold hydrolase [Nocardia sp. NBC_01730]
MVVEDQYIPTQLGTVRVRLSGSGDPILMWPSLLMDHSLWDAQVDHLSTRFTTIALDPPGHGQSSRLASTFTFDECATCIVQILDALGFERTHVLGNSWGAMVGATFAARHPERVGCSILMNGTASPAPTRQKVEYAALVTIIRMMGGIRPPLTRSVVGAFLGPTSRKTRPATGPLIVDVARRQDAASLVKAVRSVVPLRPDQRDLLATIRTPTLIIAGREDVTFPPAEVQRMAAVIPNSEFVLIEDAAHLVALEVPDRVNMLIDDFIQKHERTGQDT